MHQILFGPKSRGIYCEMESGNSELRTSRRNLKFSRAAAQRIAALDAHTTDWLGAFDASKIFN
jgi:hypothetical protein